jgi:hypothetical protein
MAGICWRLLATFSLIFVAPRFLCGQSAAADRVPVPAPTLAQLRYSPPIAPVRIPVPDLPLPYPIAPGTTVYQQLVFRQLLRVAGIIFSGRVTAAGPAPSSSAQSPPSTSVTFQVEHAMRGASVGQNLTIHEWAGLWTGGERYHVGERVFLFLYAPSKLGLTSPVGGAMGRFAMDSEGNIVISDQHMATLAADRIMGGKVLVPYADFALAVRRSAGEE